MAAAVIEALFCGSDAFDFEPDPSAVIIWFSDDPSLNEQTRFRLLEASDKLNHGDLITIQHPFSKRELDTSKVYFLNTGKLTKSSLLTRGHQDSDDADVFEGMEWHAIPDLQGWTIWETIANTIDNPDKTLYVVLDEAHQGFGKVTKDKPTIVKKLVDGHASYPPVPIVWGISATIQKFRDAMDAAHVSQSRRVIPPVTVDGFEVQASGLIKDTVVLEIPAEAGNLDSVLLRRAATKFQESTRRWAVYSHSQGLAEPVIPLMILQAPNKPNHDAIGAAIDVISEVLGDLNQAAVAHVFGEHTLQVFGGWHVDYVAPQHVQERTRIRVLIAKDAISTGWDCPRAEILISFRPAQDKTHMAQLLGRMTRNPLARRIPGDEVLNSVECILPFFDRTTAGEVIKFITGKTEDLPGISGQKTILDPCNLTPNSLLDEAVWTCWDSIPSLSIPKRGVSPIKQLVSLSLQLSKSNVRPGAVSEIEQRIHELLDGAKVEFHQQMKVAAAEVWAARGQALIGGMQGRALRYEDFVERADDRAIRSAFEEARKKFGADIADAYVNKLAGPDEDGDDGLRDAYVVAAALATVKEVAERMDETSSKLVRALFAEHRVAIMSLPDADQTEFESIRALAVQPIETALGRPRTRIEDYSVVGDDDVVGVAELLPKHLMADAKGMFPVSSLNNWELDVVKREIARQDSLAWYRNPPRPASDSLGIAYRGETGNWRSLHPDFIFFSRVGGEVKASIVDPHGHHLEDTLAKLQALANFAAEYGTRFHRIEALSVVSARMRVLDLQKPEVRDAVLASTKAPAELYASTLAADYS